MDDVAIAGGGGCDPALAMDLHARGLFRSVYGRGAEVNAAPAA